MKKSEFAQLTQIIEHIVAKEVKKQLPAVIDEVFQNMMAGKTVVAEQTDPIIEKEEKPEPTNFRASLKELFNGTPVMAKTETTPKKPRQFTKNPVLNAILNETTSDLRDRERLVGNAAVMAGYSPSLALVPGSNPPSEAVSPVEGQESNHAPLAELPAGTSVLDVKHQAPAAVSKALTRNYAQMMKLIDKKRGKI